MLGKSKYIINWITRFSLISSILVMVVLYLGAESLAVRVFKDHLLTILLRIIIFSIPFSGLILIITYTFSGYKELRYHVFLRQLIEPTLKVIFTAGLIVLGLGVIEWTYMYVFVLVLTAGIGGWFLFSRILKPLSDRRAR